MLTNTNQLSLMVDIHVLLNLVLFPNFSSSKKFKDHIPLLLRLIKNDCIELYTNQSTIIDCIKYISVKYPNAQKSIVGDLLNNIINFVPSHFENDEPIMQNAYKLWLDANNELSFDDSLLLNATQYMGYSRILSDSQKSLNYSHLSQFENNCNLRVFNINTLMEWIKDQDMFSEVIDYKNLITVVTPIGEKIELPIGATPIDFAYAIHREIGNAYHQAIVNNQEVSPHYQLQKGDQIEIFTKKDSQPQIECTT